MGNNSSIIKDNSRPNLKQLVETNSEFLTKLNEIATNYILSQNFQDMVHLTNSKYCDDLVIITSTILKKSYSFEQIHYAYNKMFDSTREPSNTNVSNNPIFFKKQDIELGDLMNKDHKKKMCIHIAKFYVKLAHLFAAIITTLNPVFSWRTSASSSRATLKPYVKSDAKNITGMTGMTDMTDMTHMTDIINEIKPNDDNAANSANYVSIGADGGGMFGTNPINVDVDVDVDVNVATLEDKQYIPEMAKDIQVENLNFCNSRISDLMDMEEITNLIEGRNAVIVQGEQNNANNANNANTANTASTIKIKTKLCSSACLNNNNTTNTLDGVSRKKTVYDLPGFAELNRLYYDKYNSTKGRFDRMSNESMEEKKRNVDLLYILFTGNKHPPTNIISFKDIPLHSFSDTVECDNDNPGSLFNKTYIGTTKDTLFVDYVEMIKKMIFKSNMIRNSLLEIIDKIFIINRQDIGGIGGIDDTSREPETKKKYIIDPKLTFDELSVLIVEARKIIIKLYITCESDFLQTLKIFQAIIETQMLETSQRQIKELEHSIEAEYAT